MKYTALDNKELKKTLKKPQQKYLLLLSNQVTIIASEFDCMRQWLKNHRDQRPIEMLPTSARINTQTTVLTKLLESLEREKEPKN